MSEFPQTRETLLLRVRDPSDREAWAEFVSIYRPVIYRLARQRGMQDADALDLVQKVLISVSNAVGEWVPDESKARFRTWLSKITHNAIIDAFRRLRPDVASGGSSVVARLQGQHAAPEISEAEVQNEFRRETFRRAALVIQEDFEHSTWQAFWRSTVDNQSVESVAEQLGTTVGAVYSARARVMRRLREEVQKHVSSSDKM